MWNRACPARNCIPLNGPLSEEVCIYTAYKSYGSTGHGSSDQLQPAPLSNMRMRFANMMIRKHDAKGGVEIERIGV